MRWVRQSMFTGKRLPATVITLVGDVTFAEFGLQFPQVQPCLIILRNETWKFRLSLSSLVVISRLMGLHVFYVLIVKHAVIPFGSVYVGV